MRPIERAAGIIVWLGLTATSSCTTRPAGEPTGTSSSTSSTSASAATTSNQAGARPVEWLAIAPRSYLDELEPLVALRGATMGTATMAVEDALAKVEPGRPREGALRDAIADYRKKNPTLRFVVLVGVPGSSPAAVPAFVVHRRYDFPGALNDFPSDHGYELAGGTPALAVGRLPARTEADVSAMVRKLVAYEAPGHGGAWQKRINVIGGPGNFGAFADGLIEAQATALLDGLLSYDLDVGVMFAKEGSPFMYRPDRMGQKIVDDMNAGSLFTVYAGHGLETALDSIRYRQKRYWIGTASDFARVDVPRGNPLFVSLTCSTGAFALADDKHSLAEDLVLNEHGPIATFASSAESHPYPNILYAEALLEAFFQDHAATIGEGIVKAKAAMVDKSMALARFVVEGDHDALKSDHLDLYNLFGDPATRLRYAGTAKVVARVAKTQPSAEVTVDVDAPATAGAKDNGRYVLTVETERAAIKPGIVSSYDLDAMGADEAFDAMVKNQALANDKVLSKAEGTLDGGKATVKLKAPDAAGKYYIKVIVSRDGEDPTIAHATLEVVN
ncbi:MAG: C25 family cysteine peptidase [Polyangiaceae bacterium]